VHVDDVARIAIEESAPGVVDAVGPETFTYRGLVQQVGRAVGARARIVPLPERAVVALGRAAGAALHDTVVTAEELGALTASLLTSDAPARGTARFTEWLARQGDWLGCEYHSELDRHWRRP
jgi:NADH dehydrogenase